MEICDIQIEENTDYVIVTFCSALNSEDLMTIKISTNDAWQITKFCRERLSYGAKVNKRQQ